MPIPAGVICGFTGAAVAVPAGWSRVVALDSRHTRGADIGADGGGTGGGASHVHDGTHDHNPMIAHNHPDSRTLSNGAVFTTGASGGLTSAIATHNHQFLGTSTDSDTLSSASTAWTTVTQEPPWYGVIWIQSNGTPEGIPVGALAWWDAGTAPTGFSRHTLSGGRYLKGAVGGQNAGLTGGSAATHTHTDAANHIHVSSGHTHTELVGGPSATNSVASGSVSAADGSHSHNATTGSATITSGAETSASTTTAAGIEPPFVTLLAITPSTPAAPIGVICLWLGTVASIPAGWILCDGLSGTPDCRGVFIKASATGTDIGTTGGSATHTHTNSTAHGHTALAHFHVQTDTTYATSSISIDNSGTPLVSAQTNHLHTGVPVTSNSPMPGTLINGVVSPVGSVDSRPPYMDVLYIQLAQILDVTITAPTPDQVETAPTPTVAWTIQAGHTQAKYLVNIYTSDLATRVYSSGIVTSAASTISVPSGNVHNGHSYKVYVTLWDTGDVSGTAGPVSFSEVYTEPPGTTLTAVAVPTGIPPYIQLTWPAPSVPGGDVFVQWNVLRRVFGSADWVTIATSTNQALRGYNDYTAAPGTEYEYAITFTDTRGGDPVTSEPQSPPPNALLSFLGSWIHVVSDPSIYLGYRSNGVKWVQTQDQVGRFAWGRAQPTWHIGSQHWKSGQITEAPDFMPAYGGPTITTSQMVDQFLTAQASGAVLCYRFGQTHERYFVIIDASQQNTSRTDDLAMSEQDIMINETFYDESAHVA